MRQDFGPPHQLSYPFIKVPAGRLGRELRLNVDGDRWKDGRHRGPHFARERAGDKRRSFAAPLALVEMRIGLVADERIACGNHICRKVRMQIEGADHRS